MSAHCAVIPLSAVARAAQRRPAAYYVDVVFSGRVQGDLLLIPWDAYWDLHRRWGGGGLGFEEAVRMVATAPEGSALAGLSDLVARQLVAINRVRRSSTGCPSCLLAKLQNRVISAVAGRAAGLKF